MRPILSQCVILLLSSKYLPFVYFNSFPLRFLTSKIGNIRIYLAFKTFTIDFDLRLENTDLFFISYPKLI